jgi:hypothetical protein
VVEHTCTFAGRPSRATCVYSQRLGPQSLVSYRAEVVPGRGTLRTTPEIWYAGGSAPSGFLALPIRWHHGSALDSKLNIGFFPDSDYASYDDFAPDLEGILAGTFFNYGQPFARAYTQHRDDFNLWVGAPGSNSSEGCSMTFSSNAEVMAAVTDGDVIVHKREFRDCSAIQLGGPGTVWGASPMPDYLLVHESGHFLHGQGDEYCCDGGYATGPDCSNVFAHRLDCEAAAPAAGADPSACVAVGDTGEAAKSFRVGIETKELMADFSHDSDWQDNSNYCVAERFLKCASGQCYPRNQ